MSEQKGTLAYPERGEMSVVGTRPPRVDGVDKVLGRAVFGADIDLPGLIHGSVLRSPYAHARIVHIDTRRAETLPGVHAVVTARDLPPMDAKAREGGPAARAARENTFASDKVLYVGHAVAAVAASRPELAARARDLIDVEYEVLPPVVELLDAMADGAALLHDDLYTTSVLGSDQSPSNVSTHVRFVKGDLAQGFAEADEIVDREFRTAMVHQGYLEPQVSTAIWSGEQLTIYTTTQGAFGIRDQVVELLQLPLSSVRVVPLEVGGGFGGKNRSHTDAVAALLARKSRRPVQVQMTRPEVFLATGPSSGTVIHVQMGATRDGRITAAQAKMIYETGAFPVSSALSGANIIFAPYDIANGQIDAYDVVVNRPWTSTYRAPGATPASFAAEQVVDELAERLGMDPLAFRMHNRARPDTRRITGALHGSIGCAEVLDAARAHEHYSGPLAGENRGRGVAHGFWVNWGGQSSCVLSVNGDGTVTLVTGSVDLSGTRTSLAMQAAEALGLPLDRVHASVGDTDSVGYTSGSVGSRTTMATGIAVARAVDEIIAKLSARAALLWRVPPDAVSFEPKGGREGGTFRAVDASGEPRQITFEALAARLSGTGGPVSAAGCVDVSEWGTAFGTHIADVEVDPETGRVMLLRYTVIQDVGRAIHPTFVEGQMQGGAVQGIGWGLYEGYAYNAEGQLENPTFLDYKLPTALDVPSIETVIVEVPHSAHPFGVRGVGEMPIILPQAAIANAIYHAVGVRLDELPMTPERILRAMGVIEQV